MKRPQIFAVVPAAGMGKRMGAGINKQYLSLAGKPILAHTLEFLQQSTAVDSILLVIPEEEIHFCRTNIVDMYSLEKVTHIIPGGKERQNSVMNAMRVLETIAEPDDIVIIHDGVRPFLNEQMITESIQIAHSGTGALVAVPVKDTIKIVDDRLSVVSTPDRSMLWQAQTPQTFCFGQILEACKQAENDNFTGTDDCSLFENYGGTVRIITGSYRNIKITTPEDLVLAEAFLQESNREHP